MVIFLIPFSFSFHSLSGQTKTKEEQQAEIKLQQEIDLQKKAMVESNKALDEQKQIPDTQLPGANSNPNQGSRSVEFYDIRNTRSNGTGSFNGMQTVDHFASGRTTWDFSKSVIESTFTTEYRIDVDKGSKDVSFSIFGTCRSGEIQIEILAPGGKPYSDAVIDEFGNLNWRKSFQIAEDNTDLIGEWLFKISAKNATGNFNISLRVN